MHRSTSTYPVIRHRIINKVVTELRLQTKYFVTQCCLPKHVLNFTTQTLELWIRIPVCVWLYVYVFVFCVDRGVTKGPIPRCKEYCMMSKNEIQKRGLGESQDRHQFIVSKRKKKMQVIDNHYRTRTNFIYCVTIVIYSLNNKGISNKEENRLASCT